MAHKAPSENPFINRSCVSWSDPSQAAPLELRVELLRCSLLDQWPATGESQNVNSKTIYFGQVIPHASVTSRNGAIWFGPESNCGQIVMDLQ